LIGFIETIRALARTGELRISEHGYDELAEDGLTVIYAEATEMRRRKKTKYVHEGRYVAEVEVVLTDDETGWSPYLSLEDAGKLDEVREALRRGDLKSALNYGQIYELRQVASQ
jgi:hypothetical protein